MCLLTHDTESAIGALRDAVITELTDTASPRWIERADAAQAALTLAVRRNDDRIRQRAATIRGAGVRPPSLIWRGLRGANPMPASTRDETCPDCEGRGVIPYVYPVLQDGGVFPGYGETTCLRCGGDGVPPVDPEQDVCPACAGRGWELERAQTESGSWIDVQTDCMVCGGSGIALPEPDDASPTTGGYHADDFEMTPAGANWR